LLYLEDVAARDPEIASGSRFTSLLAELMKEARSST